MNQHKYKTTTSERISELKRELATRERLFPDWIKQGRLRKYVAQHRIDVIRDTIADLEKLHHPAQPSLFDQPKEETENNGQTDQK